MVPKIAFLNPLPVYGIAILLAILGAALFFAFSRFSVPVKTRTRLLLAGLRILLVSIIFFMILDPYRSGPRDTEWVGVLVDTSESMKVREPERKISRIDELLDYFKRDRFWKQVEKKMVRKVYAFDSDVREISSWDQVEAKGDASELWKALKEIDRRYHGDPNLLGWIVFSDGAATDFSSEKMPLLDELTFPWIAVAVGKEGDVPNLRMEAPRLQDPVFVGEILPVEVQWDSTLGPDAATFLNVKLDGKPLLRKQVKTQDKHYKIELPVKEPGSHTLEMELSPLEGEGSGRDNAVKAWFQAKPRQINVFYSESFYKDENRFKKALEEDADFRVSFATSLVGFAKQHSVPFIRDPLYGFPKSREELLQYDVIVLSDVKRNLLNQDQIAWIRELVEKGGGALAMIGGIDSFGDGGYVGTEIEKMLPVEISEEYKKDAFLAARGTVENPFRPVLVKESRDHPVIQLAAAETENSGLWKTMPLLGGYNYVGRLKPGATALLQHPVDRSTFGPRIILAVETFGQGKTLAFTSDVTPNWGQWFQDWRDEKHGWLFAQFWRNAIKWLTENRLRHRIAPLELETKPLLVEANEPFEAIASLPFSKEPGPESLLHFEILRKTEILRSRDFKKLTAQNRISWPVDSLEPGDYLLRVLLTQPKKPPLIVEKLFVVHLPRRESKNLKMAPENLRELSRRTGGVHLAFSNIQRLEETLAKIRKLHLRQSSRPFWHQLPFYLVILIILCLDWFVRKKEGLE